MNDEQFIPHSAEAEQATLGAILFDSNALMEVQATGIEPSDFFIIRHQWIYEAMLRLADRREPLDFTTLVAELESAGKLSEVGGGSYLLSLVNSTPSSLNADGYAAVVRRNAIRRALIQAAQSIVRVAHSAETEIEEVVSRAEKALLDVTRNAIETSGQSWQDAVRSDFDRTLEVMRTGQATGLGSGLLDIDFNTGGFRRGELIIIAAGTKVGKSAWLSTFVKHNAEKGIAGGVFSLEMNAATWQRRAVVQKTGIPFLDIEQARFGTDGYRFKEYSEAVDHVQAWPVAVCDKPSLTPPQLAAKAARMVRDYDIQYVIVDYLQLMHGGAAYRGGVNRVQEVSYVVRELKAVARELDIPVIAAAQINRAGVQETRPQLHHLNESGDIERTADMVCFLVREPKASDTEFIIAASRNGPTGTKHITYLAERMLFVNQAKGVSDR